MIKANKLVIGNLVCIFLILAWSSIPDLFKNDKLWDAAWYNAIWIVLFFIPLIAIFFFEMIYSCVVDFENPKTVFLEKLLDNWSKI